MNLNKVQLAGKITKELEKKSLPNGSSVVNFSLAINRKYKDANGNIVEEVEFANCVIFGKSADALHQYAIKGQTIFVEGRLKTRSWEDKKSGETKYRTEIICDNFQFGQKPLGAENRPQQEERPDVQGQGYGGEMSPSQVDELEF